MLPRHARVVARLLERLPGVGERTAARYVLHLLASEPGLTTALAKALEGTNIKLMRHNSRDPISVVDDKGASLGSVAVDALTDQKSGYIFAEEGRPANFLSNASLPFVLQQASAYFNTQIRMNNGQRASMGPRMGPGGQGQGAKGMGPKGISGKGMSPEARQRLREHKVDGAGLKAGKAQRLHSEGGAAEGTATEGAAEGSTGQ